MSKVTFLKKIVSKNLVEGKIKDIAATVDDGKILELYKVVGQATGYKVGTSNYGEWTGFTGNFEAYNINGEIFKSNMAFVQEPLQTMIRAQLDNDVEMVEFGLSVSVKRRDDLEVGYEYVISPIIEVKESDALSHLRAMALPAPEEEEKPADKPAAKKGK